MSFCHVPNLEHLSIQLCQSIQDVISKKLEINMAKIWTLDTGSSPFKLISPSLKKRACVLSSGLFGCPACLSMFSWPGARAGQFSVCPSQPIRREGGQESVSCFSLPVIALTLWLATRACCWMRSWHVGLMGHKRFVLTLWKHTEKTRSCCKQAPSLAA